MTPQAERGGSAGRHAARRIAATLFLIAAASAALWGGDDSDAVRERWLALFRQRAESLEVSFVDGTDRSLTVAPEPAMIYTNPVRKELPYGSLFVWTESGRPVFAAAWWSALEQGNPGMRRLSREFHVLTDAPISVAEAGERIWASSDPGIEWSNVRSDPPHNSRTLRLSQMRRIVRRVQAEIMTQESELRLLPQPIYRYSEETDVLDGAIFAFVMGTDPELLVHIEARPAADGSPDWFLGFSHFSNGEVRALLDGAEVYRAERWTQNDPTGRHQIAFGVERFPEDLLNAEEIGQ